MSSLSSAQASTHTAALIPTEAPPLSRTAPRPPTSLEGEMEQLLTRQKQAFWEELPVSEELRVDRLQRAADLLYRYKQQLCEAMSEDFGHRSSPQSMLTDIYSSLEALRHARKHVHAWMKGQKRHTPFPLGWLGARARIQYQPLGVVGLISPWNFPVNLTFAPLAGIFAAGNRVMIKPSEHTPATSALLKAMFREGFAPSEACVFTGDASVGAAFSRLPFDHLMFTGSTSVGRLVMRAAAENLVPVTLELGGKSPVILSRDNDLRQSLTRILTGKMLNAGQICLSPDYLLVPEEQLEQVETITQELIATMYPTMRENPDYTSLIHERRYQRLQQLLDDAQQKGARVVEINPAQEDFSKQATHKMPLYLVFDVDDQMLVMQEELFGPILPVKSYKKIEDVLQYINAHPKPLALYYFGHDEKECTHILERTSSGSVAVNDVILQVTVEDIPFGGVGPSGMGMYHGFEGFKNFSNSRSIFTQSSWADAGKLFRPPYGDKVDRLLKLLLKK